MVLFLTLMLYNCCQVSFLKNDSSLAIFENVAYITLDSCKKWSLPNTQFKIEYPNDFIAEYNADSKYYLRLRKFTGHKVSQEITIGKSEIDNKKDTEFWLKKLNKGLNSQFESYQLLFLGEKKFLDSTYYLLQCQINFDQLEDSKFVGDYYSSVVIFLPPSNKENGVSISILRDSISIASTEKIMKTFKFLH